MIKKLIIITIASLLVIFVLFQLFFIPVSEEEIEYRTRSEYSSDDFEFHQITSEVAVSIAKTVWRDMYGRSVLIFRRIYVDFDEEENAWILFAGWKALIGGSSPHIMIDRDTGEIRSVWQD
jgi:hypothetical protein